MRAAADGHSSAGSAPRPCWRISRHPVGLRRAVHRLDDLEQCDLGCRPRLVSAGPVPWTIVPATQFHDSAAMVASWTEHDGVATIAPLLVKPIAPADVADVLAELTAGKPQSRYVNVAGPEPQDLVDMARRTNQARGRAVRLVPTWSAMFGPEMAGNVLLPGEGSRIAPTTFDEWLYGTAIEQGAQFEPVRRDAECLGRRHRMPFG